MANDLLKFEVTGLKELTTNLAQFAGPGMLGKIIRLSLAAGAQLPLQRARVNARTLGLGFMGFVPRRWHGESHGQSRRYGRIPVSLKANRAYIPQGSQKLQGKPAVYRLNILARGQKWPGIYRNKAPHAHLIEYGFRHVGSGGRIAGRAFMGPALDATAPQVVELVAHRMQGLVDGLKFPVTGRGP